MTANDEAPRATLRPSVVNCAILILLAVLPWPENWELAQDIVDSARSPETNRRDHDGHAFGYYESLISGGDGSDGPRGELSFRLISKPTGLGRFQAADVVRYLDDDFLQFELKPNVRRTLFGQPFVTNEFGMHDDAITVEKPEGTFRVAVLGASMDMGWGVKYQDTYINKLQEWLIAHAAYQGGSQPRTFEVLNFAVAAYSPLQRLDTLRRKVMRFHPDLVIYSATTLDTRLMEIHICELLRKHVGLEYEFLDQAIARVAIKRRDLRSDADARNRLKKKLRPLYWALYDQTLGAIAGECRLADVPVVVVIIPRVGKDDVPALRAEPVARLKAIAAHNGLPAIDLSDTFDPFDPATLEIAAWDNHPNAVGHRRLFVALARAVARDEALAGLLFPASGRISIPDPETGEPIGPEAVARTAMAGSSGSLEAAERNPRAPRSSTQSFENRPLFSQGP